MKFSHQLIRSSGFWTMAWLAVIWSILPAALRAAEPETAITEQSFASPAAAVSALQSAVKTKDQAALREIFGPEVSELLTGDKVQDANNARRFAAAMAQNCNLASNGENEITLQVGTNNWPMPIPLVQTNGQWHFDTAAGKEEIINRHIGKDELTAIGVCRTYVTAQQQFARLNPAAAYARRFKSTPGQRDGLYWPAAANEPASPFGDLVAAASAEGYAHHKNSGPHPFHGYYFKILTRQGAAAPGGKMNYLRHGKLTGGFALVAYPEHWNQSGVMTFIVNQDGKVFQQNLGEKTFQTARAMKEYNPDNEWTLVQDQGILNAALEK